MVKQNDLCGKLLKFAIDVILFLRTVKNTVETMDMKRQHNWYRGIGHRGILHKPYTFIPYTEPIQIEPVLSIKLGDDKMSEYLVKESSELKLILASIINKL